MCAKKVINATIFSIEDCFYDWSFFSFLVAFFYEYALYFVHFSCSYVYRPGVQEHRVSEWVSKRQGIYYLFCKNKKKNITFFPSMISTSYCHCLNDWSEIEWWWKETEEEAHRTDNWKKNYDNTWRNNVTWLCTSCLPCLLFWLLFFFFEYNKIIKNFFIFLLFLPCLHLCTPLLFLSYFISFSYTWQFSNCIL